MSEPERTNRHLFDDMLYYGNKAIAILDSRAFSEIEADETALLAITRCIEIIGEASRKLADEIRVQNPQIPWSQIIGMRHKLAHGYDSVDDEVVFQTVRDSLPPFLIDIQSIVDREYPSA